MILTSVVVKRPLTVTPLALPLAASGRLFGQPCQVGLQQDPRPRQFARLLGPPVDHLLQPLPFFTQVTVYLLSIGIPPLPLPIK